MRHPGSTVANAADYHGLPTPRSTLRDDHPSVRPISDQLPVLCPGSAKFLHLCSELNPHIAQGCKVTCFLS